MQLKLIFKLQTTMAKMSSIVATIFVFIAAVSQEGHAAYSETAFLALQAQIAGNRAKKKLD